MGATDGAAGSGSVRQARSFDEQDFVIPKPLKTAVRSRRRRRSESEDDSTAGTSRAENRGRSSSSSRRKKKKKEANPLAEFGKVVFGARDEKRGFMNVGGSLHPKTKVESGLMEEACGQLLLDYFRSKRK